MKNYNLTSNYFDKNKYFILIPTGILLTIFTLIIGDYLIYFTIIVLCAFPIYLYGEKFILFFILVTLFTLVSDVGKTIREVIQVLDFTLLSLLFFYHYELKFKEYPRIPRSLVYFLMFYYFSLFLATALSSHLIEGIQKIIQQTEFFGITYFIYAVVKKNDDLRAIIYGLVTASIIIVIATVANFINAGFILSDYTAGKAIRVSGLLGNVLSTTTFFVISMPLLITSIISQDKVKVKKYLLLLIMIILIGLILTATRSAIFSVVLSTVFIFYFHNKKLVAVFSFIIIILALIFMYVPPFSDIGLIVFRIKEGLSNRQYYWQMAYDMILDNFWFGIGPGSYGYEMYNYFPVMLNSWIGKVFIKTSEVTGGNNNSHNYFLVLISDMGIAGLITSITLPFIFFRITFRTIKKYRESNRMTYYTVLGLAAAGISVFVRAAIDGIGILSYGFISADLPFWLLFIALAYYYLKDPESKVKINFISTL